MNRSGAPRELGALGYELIGTVGSEPLMVRKGNVRKAENTVHKCQVPASSHWYWLAGTECLQKRLLVLRDNFGTFFESFFFTGGLERWVEEIP
jgi:hypothetical protein